MKVIYVYDYDTRERLGIFRFGEESFTNCLLKIEKQQEKEDMLQLKRTGRLLNEGFALGISRIYSTELVECSVKMREKLSSPDIHGVVFDQIEESNPSTLKFLEGDGTITDTGKKIIVIGYQEGLILNIGRSTTNIFGYSFETYFVKFFSSPQRGGGGIIKSSSGIKQRAKIFENPHKAYTYIKKYKKYFVTMVEEAACFLSIEYGNTLFQNHVENFSPKALNKWEKQMEQLEELLKEINSPKSNG